MCPVLTEIHDNISNFHIFVVQIGIPNHSITRHMATYVSEFDCPVKQLAADIITSAVVIYVYQRENPNTSRTKPLLLH